jgi:hypothetical protein
MFNVESARAAGAHLYCRRFPHGMRGPPSSRSNRKKSRDCPDIGVGDPSAHRRNLPPNCPDRSRSSSRLPPTGIHQDQHVDRIPARALRDGNSLRKYAGAHPELDDRSRSATRYRVALVTRARPAACGQSPRRQGGCSIAARSLFAHVLFRKTGSHFCGTCFKDENWDLPRTHRVAQR